MPRRRRSAAAGYLLLLSLLGPSCDKMPLMAPSSSTLTLYAARVAVGLNGAVDVTATVIESAGTPVQNGTVVAFTTTLGTLDPFEARTNDGKVTVKFNSGTQSGTAEIRASSGGNIVKDPLKISVGATAAGRVELLANPTALSASGGSVQLTAIVSDVSGNRLGGIPVSFATDSGLLGETSVTTDANGEARTVLSTTVKAIVSASVVGGTSGTVKSDNLTIPVRVGPTVSITVPSASLVPGSPGLFVVNVTAGTGGSAVRSANITFGDGGSQSLSTSGASTASHIYARGGTFIVTATATDTAGESTTATASVSVQDVLVTISAFTVSPSTLTTAVVADFTVTASSSSPTAAPVERYEWNFGDGQTLTTYGSGFTSHKYGEARTYTASVRVVTTTGASATATKAIVVGGADVTITAFTVNPASPTTGTPAEFAVVATSTVTIARYEWTFGDGATSTTVTPFTSHIYTSAIANATVSVKVVTTTGASATATKAIVVGSPGGSVTISSFTVNPASPSTGTPAEFTVVATSTGTIASYEWTFGDGTTSTTSTPFTSHIYTSAIANATVSVKVVTTTGASATATKEIVVGQPSVTITSFSAIQSGAAGTEVEFTASATSSSGSIDRYEWAFGDTETRTTPNGSTSHKYVVAKAYTVSVRVVATTGASATATREITVR